MSREWKPGDVAIVDGPGKRLPITFYENDETSELMFNNGSGFQHRARNLASNARPLVAIDPEDREQVERLVRAFWAHGTDDCDDPKAMQAALRGLIEPPKCPAALIVKGEHFGCDGPLDHGMAHGNTTAGAIWGES